MTDFVAFPKIPRLSREMVITEKLDGTNASVTIVEPINYNDVLYDGRLAVARAASLSHDVAGSDIFAGSRTRFITPNSKGNPTDNFGFAAWVRDNAEELVKLGPGTHYGEWWGRGIQRGYALDERRFSLFNTGRWVDPHGEQAGWCPDDLVVAPACCHVVPVLHRGLFDEVFTMPAALGGATVMPIKAALDRLASEGSAASPGFTDPEGIMIYHTAAGQYFKKTLVGDENQKG